jgi:hypothetical protein
MHRPGAPVSRKSNTSQNLSPRLKCPRINTVQSCFSLREDFLTTPPNDAVTLACLGLEPAAIRDLDIAASVADQASFLEVASDQRQGRSAHPEHLGKKLLRERKPVTVMSISGLQQPSAKPRFKRMQCITTGRLLNHHHQPIAVTYQEVLDGSAAVHRCFKSLELRSATRPLRFARPTYGLQHETLSPTSPPQPPLGRRWRSRLHSRFA